MYKVNSNEQVIEEEDGLNKYSHPLQPQQQCFFPIRLFSIYAASLTSFDKFLFVYGGTKEQINFYWFIFMLH